MDSYAACDVLIRDLRDEVLSCGTSSYLTNKYFETRTRKVSYRFRNTKQDRHTKTHLVK